MPFRTKAKALFKSRTRNDSLSTTSTNDSHHSVYQPGEPMPPPKYRRPAKKEHTDKLEAFSFADAWRKRSFQSSHSPMGTRASSRRASMLSTGPRKSRRSVHVANAEEVEVQKAAPVQKGSVAGAGAQATGQGKRKGEDGVTSATLSKTNSKDTAATLSRPRTKEGKQANAQPNGLHKTMSTAHDHQPFSEQDIAKAMQRSNMQVSAQS